MNLDDFLITCYCWVDDMMVKLPQHLNLWQRGPMPKLSDSKVLTTEVVGSYLGISQDEALFVFFHEHYANFFPSLTRVHHSTSVRQAANLRAIKGHL